jgi:cell division protein FtsL
MMILTSVSVAIWVVFLYNQLVDFRHDIKNQEASISRAQVANAELKNNLYTIVDANKLESSFNNQSLILEKNPEYVKKPVVASY